MSAPTVPSEAELARALKATHYPSDEHVQRRARLLHEDLLRLQIEGFRLLPVQTYPAGGTRPEIRVVEYEFGPVSFSLENAKDPASVRGTVQEMAGTGINREDVLYFSQICEMAHTLIPTLWTADDRLIEDVKLPSKHLNTLNEVWWLGRWVGLDEKALQREVSIVSNSDKTIDWRFRLLGLDRSWSMNLEVKRNISSIGARAYKKNHYFYTAFRGDGSINNDDPRLKFRPSLNDEVNVLAVTWFDEISAELESEIQRFLDESDNIDAVIVWAAGDRRRSGWMRFFPRFREIETKRQVLSSLLLEPNEEDHARIIAFWFPRTLESIQREVSNSSQPLD